MPTRKQEHQMSSSALAKNRDAKKKKQTKARTARTETKMPSWMTAAKRSAHPKKKAKIVGRGKKA